MARRKRHLLGGVMSRDMAGPIIDRWIAGLSWYEIAVRSNLPVRVVRRTLQAHAKTIRARVAWFHVSGITSTIRLTCEDADAGVRVRTKKARPQQRYARFWF